MHINYSRNLHLHPIREGLQLRQPLDAEVHVGGVAQHGAVLLGEPAHVRKEVGVGSGILDIGVKLDVRGELRRAGAGTA